MFRNIGGKIKVLVTVAAVLGILTCIACGVIMIVYAAFDGKIPGFLTFFGLDKTVMWITSGKTGFSGIISGVITAVFGSFLVWIAAFIPYGLGQLIQNTDRMTKSLDSVKRSLSEINLHKASEIQESGVFPYPVYLDEYGRPFYYVDNGVNYGEEQVQDGDLVPSQNGTEEISQVHPEQEQSEETAGTTSEEVNNLMNELSNHSPKSRHKTENKEESISANDGQNPNGGF